jgi:hypothetical protein
MILARDTTPGSYYRRTRGQAPGDYYTRHRQSVRALVKRLRGKWNKNTATTRDVSNLRRLESSSEMVAMVRHSRGVDPFTGNPFTVRQLVVIPGDTKLRQLKRKPKLTAPNPPRPRLQPYTSATSRKDALEPLAAAGWGLLFAPNTYSPKRVQFARDRGMPIVLDNGAWTAFQKGQDWRATYGDRFESVVELLGPEVEWVVAPDIVAGGAESLELSVSWLPWLLERTQTVLVPVQDGMTPGDLAPIIDAGRGRVGIFLGGSTEWKWATAPEWGELAARWGVPYHVARVNSQRALRIAATVGASSIDGSGPVRFPSMIERLERERAQETLELRAQPMPCCGVYADRFTDPTTGEQVCMNCGEAYSPGYHWKYMDPDFSELKP